MTTKIRASHDEIMDHLDRLLGPEAMRIAKAATAYFLEGNKDDGLTILTKYDSSLGGIGIHSITNKKPPGIYRAFTYVLLPLRRENPEDDTRSMIHASCSYLEELLKKIVRTWPWEIIKVDSLPLGTLVRRGKNRIPHDLYTELDWLSQGIYNFVKHHFNFENDEVDIPEHYFDLDESIAIYLFVRKLGLELEAYFGKP